MPFAILVPSRTSAPTGVAAIAKAAIATTTHFKFWSVIESSSAISSDLQVRDDTAHPHSRKLTRWYRCGAFANTRISLSFRNVGLDGLSDSEIVAIQKLSHFRMET